MTRTVWFNCCAGVAGDMLLASLIDAGADQFAVMDAWGALGVDGFAANWERVQRCGVTALWTNLAIDTHTTDDAGRHHSGHHHSGHHHSGHHHSGHHHSGHQHSGHGHLDDEHGHAHPHRPASEVLELIAAADLPAQVAADATAVYRSLAEVEGTIHGMDPDQVELHEVGALDSILDVVGVCAALRSLGIDRIVYSPIAVGHGTVDTAHGTLPNPVPAVSRLLADAAATTVGVDTTMELSTPTGVALLTVLGEACGPMPTLSISSTGFGAGTADPQGRPNVVQAIIGTEPTGSSADGGRPCHLVEVNVDDVTGEVLAHTITSLLAAGAHDAWATPIVMKKGRPAHTVHALCDDASFDAVRTVLISETGTLGVRASVVQRWPQQRREGAVDIDGHRVRVKLGADRVKVEHDDALAAATELGLSLRDLISRAEALGRELGP